MPTVRDAASSTVSTTTSHFSQYMVVDSEKWFAHWNYSMEQIQTKWISNASYKRNLHTIYLVDCSESMKSIDSCGNSLVVGYKGITEENIERIRPTVNGTDDIEAYCVNWCQRADICKNILDNKGNNDMAGLITFSSNVINDFGLSSYYSYTKDKLPEIIGSDGTAYFNSAFSVALSHVVPDTTDWYRIIVITNSDITYDAESIPNIPGNVILNFVNLGESSLDYSLKNLAYETAGDVYDAVRASELTVQVGETVTVPAKFVGEDTDGDTIPDIVEQYGLKPNGELIGTNPNNKDTDGDGIDDNIELKFSVETLTFPMTKEAYDASIYCGSDPTKADTDEDGLDDDLDNVPLNSRIHSFLLYETRETDEDLKLCSGNCTSDKHNDYHYADMSKNDLRSMKWINWSDFINSQDIIEFYIKMIANDFATGAMNFVVEDMFDYFFSGVGGDYSNDVLTNEARSHENSDRYIKETTKIINDWIKENNGDISGLEYNANNRDSSIMVSRMQGVVFPPVYEDKFSGLGICVDGTYGNQFEIESYKFDGINYEYTIKYTIYDIFGLDEGDISDPDRLIQFGILQMFRSWYILQHWNEYDGKYKPFITYIEFEETVNGTM